jgi:hypothetical protein
MPKVKIDMTGTDPEDAKGFKPIPLGMHRMKVISLDPGYSKDPDTKKEDKSRPKLTAVLQDENKRWGQQWYHLSFSDKEYPRQKMLQFLMAVGILSEKKLKAEFDTADAVGKFVEVNIVDEREQNKLPEQRGKYVPRIADVFPDSGDLKDDEFAFDDGELDTEFNTKDFDDDGESEDSPEEGLFTREDLVGKTAADLRVLLKEYDVNTKVRDVPKLIEMLLKEQAEYCAENDIEDPAAVVLDGEDDDDEMADEDDDEIMEDDDDESESESEYLTEAQLKEMDVATLKSTAKDFDVEVKGLTKSKVIAAILEAQGAEEEPF